jgi:hypothetical protein
MGNAITADVRALWLFLVKDGGWWTARQLTHHWRPTFAEYEVSDALEALAKGRFLERRLPGTPHTTQPAEFGFTSSCAPLPGQPPQEIQR